MNNAVERVEREITRRDSPVEIQYIVGDATEPKLVGESNMGFLVHCCNDAGLWGAGFVLAVSKKWPDVGRAYGEWRDGVDTIHRTTGDFQLGEVQFVQVQPDLVVCNLIGQHAVAGSPNVHNQGGPPVRYEAIELGLAKIRLAMIGVANMGHTPTFHSPKFGADRAGGKWDLIENSINHTMGATGIASTVYEWRP